MKKDKLHFNLRRVDSYNKPFNFIISEREAGKSTALLNKAYKLFKKKHQQTIIIRRRVVDITELYVNSIARSINFFLPKDKQIEITFKKGNIKDGTVEVYIGDVQFLLIIALSIDISRAKSCICPNPGMIIYDEFICNNRGGEKYLEQEAFRFKEIYNTYQRYAVMNHHRLKCYFSGNPYSLYNPYFSDLDVNTLRLKPGVFIAEKNYVIYCYRIKEALRKVILRRNPLYQFDESYKRYAFYGQAVNDQQFIVVPKRPEGFYLRYVFRLSNKYLHVWSNNTSEDNWNDCKYYIECLNDTESSKKIYAIDFNNLVQNTNLLNPQLRFLFFRLKSAIQTREVTYNNVEAGYLTEQLYSCI